MNACACGCGGTTRRTFKRGHGPKYVSFVGQVIARLTKRPQGATLAEICAASERYDPKQRRDISNRLRQSVKTGTLRRDGGRPARWFHVTPRRAAPPQQPHATHAPQ
jgi:hypothetical protein